jgi:hypothetical protein
MLMALLIEGRTVGCECKNTKQIQLLLYCVQIFVLLVPTLLVFDGWPGNWAHNRPDVTR